MHRSILPDSKPKAIRVSNSTFQLFYIIIINSIYVVLSICNEILLIQMLYLFA
jgi:hypothetical protein